MMLFLARCAFGVDLGIQAPFLQVEARNLLVGGVVKHRRHDVLTLVPESQAQAQGAPPLLVADRRDRRRHQTLAAATLGTDLAYASCCTKKIVLQLGTNSACRKYINNA